MSVKIRPISREDKTRMVPKSGVSKVCSSPMIGLDKVSKLPNNVVSDTIFGKTDHNVPDSALKEFEDKYTRVGYIDLAKPVLNQFLAGRAAPVWKRVLGLKQDEIMNIINVNTIWDRENPAGFVSLSSVGQKPFDPERYVFGADLLVMLLDRVNIDQVLEQVIISTYVKPCLSRNERTDYEEGSLNIGTIYELTTDELAAAIGGELEGWLYSNYAIDLSNSDFGTAPDEKYGGLSRREKLLEDISDLVFDSCTNELSQFSLIDVLITLKRDGVDVLKSQILDYIFVLPYGFRPTIDGRVDALTSQYNKLVNSNQELQDILDRKDPTIYTVMNKYREVVQYIRNIFIGDDYVISSQRLKDYKSISDSLSGKKGLMRDRMQGARIDYSGRAVIISDPTMPIDMIGVPIKMLMKVMEPNVIKELRGYKISEGDKGSFGWRNLSTFSQTSSKEKDGITYEEFVWKYMEDEGRYDRFGMIGRQPTLFYLGIQGFRIKPVEGDALVLSPLVVMPFNADHDGDQMHFGAVFTKRAQAELKNNMYFKANMRYPKNGEITVVTRHEIIYGLWICKNKGNAPGGRLVSEAELKRMSSDIQECASGGFMRAVYECVCKQRVNVYDQVSTTSGVKPAGVVALEFAVYNGTQGICDFNDSSFKVKAKDLTKRAADYYGTNKDGFLNAINRMVKLGFAVAKIWPPNISAIVDSSIIEHVNAMTKTFNEEILNREEYVNLGIETEEEFSSYFSREWKKLETNVTDYLVNNLDPENGYLTMWKSGAKGDQSNLRQIFGLKGRVQKNDISTFNSIISGSYAGQLTGLDHLVTAYGSRQGIADKVLATAEPGYLSRRLEHAGSIISITADDCGTDRGMEFTLEDIVPFIDESQLSKYGIYPDSKANKADADHFWDMPETVAQMDAAINYLSKILQGRYIVTEDSNSVFVENETMARHFIRDAWDRKPYGAVKMRSVIYCNCPCCKVCYGRDIAAGTDAPVIGRNVGFIAAQAIGEPGTQMTMKNFHRGGVVTEANLTSSFELIDDYFELHDFSKKRRNKRGIISYDRISPVEGYVKEQYLGNGGKRIIVTETPNEEDRTNLIPGTTKIIVQDNTVLKDHVRVGDSFQKVQGDLNIREVLRYRGYDKAASYLTLMLYNIFSTQDVAFKHFETIVAAMSVMVLATDADNKVDNPVLNYGKGSRMRAGSVLTLPEIRYGIVGAGGVMTLLGLKNLPKYKTDFFESLLMENMDSYIPRAIIMNPNDSMSNPITRAAFGLNIGTGTDMR